MYGVCVCDINAFQMELLYFSIRNKMKKKTQEEERTITHTQWENGAQ